MHVARRTRATAKRNTGNRPTGTARDGEERTADGQGMGQMERGRGRGRCAAHASRRRRRRRVVGTRRSHRARQHDVSDEKESTQRIPLWPSCARALCCYLALLVFSRRFSALLPCVVSFLCFFAHLSCSRRVQLAVCISTVARVSLLTRVVSFLCFVFYTCSGAPGNMLCDKFYCALFTAVVSFFYALYVSFVLRARVLCVVTYRCYLRVVTSRC